MNTVARVIENGLFVTLLLFAHNLLVLAVFLSFFVGALYFGMDSTQQGIGLRVAVLFFMVVMAGFLSVMNAVIACELACYRCARCSHESRNDQFRMSGCCS